MSTSQQLGGFRVAVLATEGFEQAELEQPVAALVAAGAEISIVAPQSGTILGFNHHDKGRPVDVDVELAWADPTDFDGLLMPGGALNADQLRAVPEAVAFAKSFFDADKPVGAICHAGWTLVESGVLRGRKVTSWPSIQTDLENAGASWVDAEVTVDGNLVTSRKPDDIPAFNREVLKLFATARSQAPAR